MITVIFRTALVYVLLLLAVRLLGKRQLGELKTGELVTTILISNLASLPIEETDLPIVTGMIPVFVIVCCEIIFSIIEIRSPRFSRIVSGNALPVIKDGVIDQKVLRDLRFSVADLLEGLRNKDIFDVRDVDYAVIETSGQLNVYKTFAAQETVKEDLKLKSDSPTRPPAALVVDGNFQPKAAAFCGKDRAWVDGRLKKAKMGVKDVALLQLDADDTVLLIPKEKK